MAAKQINKGNERINLKRIKEPGHPVDERKSLILRIIILHHFYKNPNFKFILFILHSPTTLVACYRLLEYKSDQEGRKKSVSLGKNSNIKRRSLFDWNEIKRNKTL